jgi:phosphoribosylanthranilate isomerase
VKICGITSVEDADLVLRAGADAVGVNLIPSSKRFVDVTLARAIVDRVRGKLMTVAVVADPTVESAVALQRELGVDYLQLHGNESPEVLRQLLEHRGVAAFKAVRIGTAEDIDQAKRYPGEFLLADARVEGALGGTGVSFDWSLAARLSSERRLIVAGGLRPDNVARAIHALHPWGVDVASGVEETGDPRKKSGVLTGALIAAVREASNENEPSKP